MSQPRAGRRRTTRGATGTARPIIPIALDQAKRLKDLEKENAWLKRLLADATALAADGRRAEAKASIAKARKAGLDGRRLSTADRARLALEETAPDPS